MSKSEQLLQDFIKKQYTFEDNFQLDDLKADGIDGLYSKLLESGSKYRTTWSDFRLGSLWKKNEDEVKQNLRRAFNRLGDHLRQGVMMGSTDTDEDAQRERRRSKNKWMSILTIVLFLASISVLIGIVLDGNIRSTIRLGQAESDVPDPVFGSTARLWMFWISFGLAIFSTAFAFKQARVRVPENLDSKDFRRVGKIYGPDEYEKRARLYGALYSHSMRPFLMVAFAFFVSFLFYAIVIIGDAIESIKKKITDVVALATDPTNDEKVRLEAIRTRLENRQSTALVITLSSGLIAGLLFFKPKWIEWTKPQQWMIHANKNGNFIDHDAVTEKSSKLKLKSDGITTRRREQFEFNNDDVDAAAAAALSPPQPTTPPTTPPTSGDTGEIP